MMKKYDFVAVVKAVNCNPNGDPLNEGRPRTNMMGYGEISAECIKRKIRNRIQDLGGSIFVQSDSRCEDGFKSLKERASSVGALEKAFKAKDNVSAAEIACETWMDVRLFGQVFAYGGGVSVGVRGAVSICHSQSISPVTVKDVQITKSTNGEPPKKKASTEESGGLKSSDTMGCKYLVENAIYTIKGSISPLSCKKNGVMEEDIEMLKRALITLFENDESSARPSGSMEVVQVYWFEQDEKDYKPTAKIFNLVEVNDDGTSTVAALPDGVVMKELVS